MRYDTLPKELLHLKQWVNAWTTSKLPMQSTVRKAAQSNNPDTWNDFETAYMAVEKGYYDYLGFVFNDNGIVGIDIDTGYVDGLPSDLMIDCMCKCKSYTEKSKSGRGIHILVKGDLPFDGKNNRNGCEIYKTGRYFIMTGKTLVFHDLIENQEAIDYIVKTYFPEPQHEDGEISGNAIYQPIWEPPTKDGKISLRPQYPPILEGGRNISLTSLAGSLRCVGYNAEQIYDELCYANKTACHPPLDDYELQSIVNSISRYDRRT